MKNRLTSRDVRDRMRQIQRYNIKGALRLIAEEQKAEEVKRAYLEKKLLERWEARRSEQVSGHGNPSV